MPMPTPNPATFPPPERIRELAGEVLARPYYRLDTDRPEPPSWLGDFFRTIIDWLEPVAEAIGGLFAVSEVVGWIVIILLFALMLGLIAHIIYSFLSLGRRIERGAVLPRDAEKVLDPEVWEQRAQAAIAAGDPLGAVRALLRASMLRLDRASRRPMRRGATNREWLGRFRSSPVHDPLRVLASTVEAKWYGHEPCTVDDYASCAAAHARIVELIPLLEQAHAASA